MGLFASADLKRRVARGAGPSARSARFITKLRIFDHAGEALPCRNSLLAGAFKHLHACASQLIAQALERESEKHTANSN